MPRNSQEQQENRLAADRESKNRKRAEESQEQQENRLAAKRESKKRKRAEESQATAVKTGLRAKREIKKRKRAEESQEQPENYRLTLYRSIYSLRCVQMTMFKICPYCKCLDGDHKWNVEKRGLPLAHILIWLHYKITSKEIDDVISAEIPDENVDKGLYDIVVKNMIHGPCGALNENSPCMAKGRCTKQYPRLLVPNTITGNDGYPQYRRRSTEDGGKTAIIKKRNGTTIEVDNQWVVPYSPLLSKTFNAHINVEYCNSVKAIKYICKYVNKGSDMAVFGLQSEIKDIDEIVQYQAGRYISSNEAVWQSLSFPIHERSPAVVHLAVHLQNGQRVYFSESNVQQRGLNPTGYKVNCFLFATQKMILLQKKTALY